MAPLLLLAAVVLFAMPPGTVQGPHEKRLLNHLLATYNTLERPVANESEPLDVKFGLTLQQIIDVESLIDEELQELHLVRVNGSLYYPECSLFYLDMYLPMYQRPCFTSCYLEDSSNYNTEAGRNYVRNCPRYIAALGGLVIDSKDRKLVGLASWGFNFGGDGGKTFPIMFTLLEQTPYEELISCALNEFDCRDIAVM